jgi:hypothetical protein
MRADIVVGLVCVGVALVAALSVRVVFKLRAIPDHVRYDTVLMTFAAFMSVGMLLPQIVKNSELGAAMHESQSPFLPAIMPIVVFCKCPAEKDTLFELQNSGFRYTAVIRITTEFFIIVVSIVWIFQFASTASNTALEVVLYVCGSVYTLLVIATSKWVFHVLTTGGKEEEEEKEIDYASVDTRESDIDEYM